MKGIILAGGLGTRLHPLTIPVSKQLLPVYDKPMIFYPLTTLMSIGVREILVITTKHDQSQFKRLLGDGRRWGLSLEYQIQDEPNGIAEAFILAEEFLGESDSILILGDNLFIGDIPRIRSDAESRLSESVIFAAKVANANSYGVVEIDRFGRPVSIEEKPNDPKSDLAVPGIYAFPSGVAKVARSIGPSARGELEITAVIQHYLDKGLLRVSLLDEKVYWFDMGTHDSLFEAGALVRALQMRTGIPIGDPSHMNNVNKRRP